MSVALSATIQQNSHSKLSFLLMFFCLWMIINLDTNNLMNPSVPNLTAAECRQSEELNNQMMSCLR